MSLVGRAALLLALGAALYAVAMAIAGMRAGRRDWVASARGAVYGTFGMTTVGIVTLWAALLGDRFEIRSVAEYSNAALEPWFKVSALWGSQAGSLLLWAWLLTAFAALVVARNRTAHRELMPVVIATLMMIAVFFLGLLSFVTSPFEVLAVVPDDGRGLNPLLQNPYMVSHPPLLYLGYVGLAVPFAFAVAALVTGRLDTAWIGAVRRWLILAWTFLGVGIILGARWAYEELGWGGYWAWDPVENAAFMPWLVATALLHSVMVQERRGMLKVWNMSLVVLTFTLALFGTFLTRSGIIASVHAFGESTLGPWFLAFIAAVAIVGTCLILMRLDELRSVHRLESFLSREAVFLFNNLLLVGLAFAVFWGTIFPVISEAARGNRITVGQGYYDQIAVPIGVALLILTGIGPLISWRKASGAQLARRFAMPLAVALAAAIVLLFATPAWESWVAGLVFTASAFVAASVVGEFWRGARTIHALGGVGPVGAVARLVGRNPRRYGGYVVHLGVVLLFIGFAGSTAFTQSGDLVLADGERSDVAGLTFVNEGSVRDANDNRMTVGAQLGVFQGEERVGTLTPAINFYRASGQRSTEIAIDTGPRRDVYVTLVGLSEDGVVRASVFINPLVMWLWIAGILIALGALISALPLPGRREPAVAPAAAGAARRAAG